jgi:hypothetical protein
VAKDYGRRAKARAETQPDWDEVARRTEALYYAVVDRPRLGARRVPEIGS